MTDFTSIEKTRSWQMFNRIAASYDALNRVLSGGIDRRWRRRVAAYLPDKPEKLRVLDLATGTGDQIIALQEAASDRIAYAVGMDLAEEMLARGRKKFQRRELENHCVLRTGDAQAIPEKDETFDVITIAFGIRNMPDPKKVLAEMVRVLSPGGRVIVLEFSLPKNVVLKVLYLFYFRHILPWVGGMVSGEHAAYRYLNKTVEAFPYGEQFCCLMREAGFASVNYVPMTFGIATIYVGVKGEVIRDTAANPARSINMFGTVIIACIAVLREVFLSMGGVG